MKQELQPFVPLRGDEFISPMSRWVTVGGWSLVGAVGSAVMLIALLPFNVTVRAPATVRPEGELHVVQARQGGTVTQIDIKANQPVLQNQVLATLDTSDLQTEQERTQGNLDQTQRQLAKITEQLTLIDAQVLNVQQALNSRLEIARKTVDLSRQDFQQQQATARADLEEAKAQLAQAQSEINRYQQLVTLGAISQQHLEEKQAEVQATAAQVTRSQAALRSTPTPVTLAQGLEGQEMAESQTTLISLERERFELLQQRATLQAQVLNHQATLERLKDDLETRVIRAPASGTLFQLEVSNPQQVVQAGDTIATIVPTPTALTVKAAIAPQDINKITLDQTAYLRLAACAPVDYGILRGMITAIAPDATTLPPLGTGSSQSAPLDASLDRYFEVTIQPAKDTLSQGNGICPLKAGMTAEATIVASQITLLQTIRQRTRL